MPSMPRKAPVRRTESLVQWRQIARNGEMFEKPRFCGHAVRVTGERWHHTRRYCLRGGSMRPRFELGAMVITSGALARLPPEDILHALLRHASGDWGDLDSEDRNANDRALLQGNRLFSAFRSVEGVRFWIITEWDRSVTTILLPEEY